MGLLIDVSITSQKHEKNMNVTLKRLRHFHLNNVIFLYLNINSSRNKFGKVLDKVVDGNIYILCIAEMKLDESFPNNQLLYQYNQSKYYQILQKTKLAWWYLLNHTYLKEALMILKYHLIYKLYLLK